ncbi:hypothetical protein [Priestia sp. P5]|uniref:hypothetical protein n=1 Tax=Priestia sp. P5 TaxID=2917806 RepID=UPI0024073D8A|nr:hypothetical protein [Priestia sp. P5]MDG0062102.1 hypothetical protein [Priestia sp. P5]
MNFFKDKFINSDFGVFISLGTFLGYVLYYVNSSRFNAYYDVPDRFLDFSFQNIVSHTFSVVLFVIAAYVLRQTILNNSFIESIEIITVMVLKVISPFMLIIMCLYRYLDWDFLTYNQEYWTVMSFCILAVWLCWYTRNHHRLISIVAIFIMAVNMANKMGEHEAITKEKYIILEKANNEKYVVVNNYKNMLIIEPVNLNTKVISPSFQFIELKSDKDNKFKFKVIHTGKLKVEGPKVFQ